MANSPQSQSGPQPRGGYEVPEPTKKDVFSLRWHKLVARRLNSLLGLTPTRGAVDRPVIIGDSGPALLPLAMGGSSTSQTSGMNYRGTYDNANSYAAGDVVRVRSGTSQGIWVCVIDQPASGSAPVYPEPADSSGTNNWDMLAFGITTFHYKDPSLSCAARKIAINSGVSSSDP